MSTMSNVIVKENETLDSALRQISREAVRKRVSSRRSVRESITRSQALSRKKKSEAARKRKYN